MEKCKSCGYTLSEKDKFCPQCGEKIFKRTVIYGPRAENIVVVDDDSDFKEKINKKPNISVIHAQESPFIKVLRIIYIIVFSLACLFLLLITIGTFLNNDIEFGIYFLTLTIFVALNIFFFVKRKWTSYWLTYLWIIIATAVSIFAIDVDQNSSTVNTNIIASTKEETESEFKEKCNAIEYEEVSRYPDRYKGEYVHIYGQAVQVIQDGNYYQIRVATKRMDNDFYDIWTDDIYYICFTNTREARILEDDMLDIYGEMDGLKTYTTTLGTQVTIPLIQAKYNDIELD